MTLLVYSVSRNLVVLYQKLMWSLAFDAKEIQEAVISEDFKRIARVVRHLPIIRKKKLLTRECFEPEYLPLKIREFLFPGSQAKTNACPEVSLWGGLLVCVWFLDEGRLKEAADGLHTLIELVTETHRAASDSISAKIFYFYAICCEKLGNLASQYDRYLAFYRTACLHRNSAAQAVLLNTLLRILINEKLYDQASKLVAKTSFPDTRSNADLARHLFYVGRIAAVRLEYSTAFGKLSSACKKAPRGSSSRGFRILANKFALVVELLLGDVPERSIFNEIDLALPLRPYFHLTEAVRTGDVNAYTNVVERYSAVFERDQTLSLVHRLHHTVIKAGLRSVSVAYSKISLDEVAKKLGLKSSDEAVSVAAKAIEDGVIQGRLEANNLLSKWSGDLYTTSEPQRQLHKRIAFCLQMHADALKAMQFPDLKAKIATIDEVRRREDEELAAEQDEDDDEMML